jgi:metal-sulfur cluster biosynthetic enzyme
MKVTKEQVLEYIKPVEDPELGFSLVDLGLIYDIDISDNNDLYIKMTLSSPACPIGPELMSMVRTAALSIDSVSNVDLELVWDPPWNPEEMASDEVKDALGIW